MTQRQAYQEINIALGVGGIYNMEFAPFKMIKLEVFNLGPNDAVAMPNDASFANAITVVANGVRTFSSTAISRILFYSVGGTKIRVVATR